MGRRVAADEWDGLTAQQCTKRCSCMALEAMNLAETAPPNLAEGYMLLAGEWLKLATEISRTNSNGDTTRVGRAKRGF